jgi:hypothetical protein
MRKGSALTAADVDNIVWGNFAPDIKKLASEIEASLGDPAALQAIGVRIVADHGQDGLRKVMHHISAIHAEEFSNSERVDRIYRSGRVERGTLILCGERGTVTKGQIAAERFFEVYRGASQKRKKTTKAEAIAQRIDALVKLLQNEPDVVVESILDNLLERIRIRARINREREANSKSGAALEALTK